MCPICTRPESGPVLVLVLLVTGSTCIYEKHDALFQGAVFCIVRFTVFESHGVMKRDPIEIVKRGLRFGDPLNTWRDKTSRRTNNSRGRQIGAPSYITVNVSFTVSACPILTTETVPKLSFLNLLAELIIIHFPCKCSVS